MAARHFLPAALAFSVSLLTSACSRSDNAVDELFAVDRAFSARSQEIGAGPAFVEFASEDVRAFPGGRVTLKGKTALAEWTSGWPAEQSVSWEPEEAFVSASGDLGYTWGYAAFTRPNEAGEKETSHGKYVTIWRRQENGEWKWIADLGNGAPPPDER